MGWLRQSAFDFHLKRLRLPSKDQCLFPVPDAEALAAARPLVWAIRYATQGFSATKIAQRFRRAGYTARVTFARRTMPADGQEVALTPGMTGTVEFDTSKWNLVEQELSSLVGAGRESLRER